MNWNDLHVRERLEEVGNYIALSTELHSLGIVFSEPARACLYDLGVMQRQNLNAAIKGQLIEGNAPS